MDSPVRPLGDRVLVWVLPKERVSAGGVLLPENIRQDSDRGIVLAVGPGSPDPVGGGIRPIGDPDPVQRGHVVVFSPFAGSQVTVGQEDYLLLREHDVLGVLPDVKIEDETAERLGLLP